MNEHGRYISPLVRRLMPAATDEEIARASECLREYLATMFTACWRIAQEEQCDSRESGLDDRFQKLAPPSAMNRYYGYIRVSTVKQGEKGSSLQEQRASIEQFAQRHCYQIVQWFEERETAAKKGRTEFVRMMAALGIL